MPERVAPERATGVMVPVFSLGRSEQRLVVDALAVDDEALDGGTAPAVDRDDGGELRLSRHRLDPAAGAFGQVITFEAIADQVRGIGVGAAADRNLVGGETPWQRARDGDRLPRLARIALERHIHGLFAPLA